MPLDGNLPAPTLRTLSTILRDRRCWPPGFEWNYNDCEKCAMGLAYKLFKEIEGPDTYCMRTTFSLTVSTTHELFLGAHPHMKFKTMVDIAPEDVADAIDDYLATTIEKVTANVI